MDVHKNSQVMTQLSIIRLSNIFSVCYFNFTVCNISQNYVWKTLFIEQNLMDKLKKKKRSYFAVGPSPANLTALRGRLASRPARHVTELQW